MRRLWHRRMDKARLVEIVVAAVRDYQTSGRSQATPASATTVLVGPDGAFDSFDLVSVVVALEQELKDVHGLSVSLMDDRAMASDRSPFRTPETIADYILALLAEAPDP